MSKSSIVAWLHNQDERVDVIHDEAKSLWIKAGKSEAVKHYTIPLYRHADGEKTPVVPLEPTPAMIEAGAQRIVYFEDGSVWPDDWSELDVMSARNSAERVWRSMWLAANENSNEY